MPIKSQSSVGTFSVFLKTNNMIFRNPPLQAGWWVEAPFPKPSLILSTIPICLYIRKYLF